MRTIVPLAAALALASSRLLASNAGSDNASNYGSGWNNGSNGGSGFGAWNLGANNNNNSSSFAGYFLGSSTDGTGNLNTGGQSFGMYANPGPAFADATRTFTGGSLALDQTFTITLGVSFRNGNKGFELLSGASTVFNFNVGADTYRLNGVDLVLAYQPDSVFTIAVTPDTATSLVVLITRTTAAGGTEVAFSGPISVADATTVSGFKLYISGTDNGNSSNNLYFNSISVGPNPIPEPATVAWLLAGGLGGLVVLRRRR